MQFPSKWSSALAASNLETDPAVIYALDRDLRIVYCNQAWDRFSEANGGRGLKRDQLIGRSVMEAIPSLLRPFFESGYRRVFQTKQAWEHTYECSSPTVYRLFRLMACPDPEGDGVVVVNTVTLERAHDSQERASAHPNDEEYVGPQGFVTMCCHCRRSCRKSKAAWDWVPAYVVQPPARVTHGICEVCLSLFYPDDVCGQA